MSVALCRIGSVTSIMHLIAMIASFPYGQKLFVLVLLVLLIEKIQPRSHFY